MPFSIGALDAQNQCSALAGRHSGAAASTLLFYSEPLKMRSAPPFPSPFAVHNIAARISPQKMNPEFKLVELSQKHFSLSPLIVSHSFLVPASGGREGFMKCLYCPKLVPKVMLKSERRCQCKMQQHGQSAQQRPKMLN